MTSNFKVHGLEKKNPAGFKAWLLTVVKPGAGQGESCFGKGFLAWLTSDNQIFKNLIIFFLKMLMVC